MAMAEFESEIIMDDLIGGLSSCCLGQMICLLAR